MDATLHNGFQLSGWKSDYRIDKEGERRDA
jgi:hypothetical protein